MARRKKREGAPRRNKNARKLGIWGKLDRRFAPVRRMEQGIAQSIEERGGSDMLSAIELQAIKNGWRLLYRTELLFADFLTHVTAGKEFPKWRDDRMRQWLALCLKFADRYGDRKMKEAVVPTLHSIAARAAQQQSSTTEEVIPVNGEEK